MVLYGTMDVYQEAATQKQAVFESRTSPLKPWVFSDPWPSSPRELSDMARHGHLANGKIHHGIAINCKWYINHQVTHLFEGTLKNHSKCSYNVGPPFDS